MSRAASLAMCAALALVPPAQAFGGRVASGTDLARIVPPAGAVIEPYSNDGYELRFAPGAVEVRVDLHPLDSHWPFELPRASAGGRVAELARHLTAGATTRYDAVAAILAWVGTNVRYELDREASQEPEIVLARRRGYCTGIARLSVALLGAVGIEAREVPGYRLDPAPRAGAGGSGAEAIGSLGFHRWIEVYYPDRGWVFSDPVASHQFVPATYLRLADERLEWAPGQGTLLERRDEIEEVDLAPGAPPLVRVRANDTRRGSAALIVRLESGDAGEASLSGQGTTRTTRIESGKGRFLGLAPGRYELKVTTEGRVAAWKSLLFRAPVLAELMIAAGTDSASDPALGGGVR